MKALYHLFDRRFAVAAALAFAMVGATAQDTKIGAVNVERILRDSNTAKAVSTKPPKAAAKR